MSGVKACLGVQGVGTATAVALASTVAPPVSLTIIGVSGAVGLLGIKSYHLEIIV